MYLFTRRAVAAPGRAVDAAKWALEAARAAADSGGIPVAAWATIFSPEVGGLTWSMRVESVAELHAATSRSQADPAYHAVVAQAAGLLAASPNDALLEVVSGTPGDGPPAFATVVQATVAPGHLLAGYAAGMEIAQTFTAVTGLPALFLRNVTGPYGGVGWITSAPDTAAIDAANDKLKASTDWLNLVDRAGAHFAGDAESRLLQRLG